MEIIKLKENDLEKSAELFVQVFNSEPWNENWTLEKAHKKLRDIYNTPNYIGFVGLMNNEIKGALLGFYTESDVGKEYFLYEIFIDLKESRKGLGSELLAYLEEYLKTKKIKAVSLVTSKDNGTSQFYFKNQYEELSGLRVLKKSL